MVIYLYLLYIIGFIIILSLVYYKEEYKEHYNKSPTPSPATRCCVSSDDVDFDATSQCRIDDCFGPKTCACKKEIINIIGSPSGEPPSSIRHILGDWWGAAASSGENMTEVIGSMCLSPNCCKQSEENNTKIKAHTTALEEDYSIDRGVCQICDNVYGYKSSEASQYAHPFCCSPVCSPSSWGGAPACAPQSLTLPFCDDYCSTTCCKGCNDPSCKNCPPSSPVSCKGNCTCVSPEYYTEREYYSFSPVCCLIRPFPKQQCDCDDCTESIPSPAIKNDLGAWWGAPVSSGRNMTEAIYELDPHSYNCCGQAEKNEKNIKDNTTYINIRKNLHGNLATLCGISPNTRSPSTCDKYQAGICCSKEYYQKSKHRLFYPRKGIDDEPPPILMDQESKCMKYVKDDCGCGCSEACDTVIENEIGSPSGPHSSIRSIMGEWSEHKCDPGVGYTMTDAISYISNISPANSVNCCPAVRANKGEIEKNTEIINKERKDYLNICKLCKPISDNIRVATFPKITFCCSANSCLGDSIYPSASWGYLCSPNSCRGNKSPADCKSYEYCSSSSQCKSCLSPSAAAPGSVGAPTPGRTAWHGCLECNGSRRKSPSTQWPKPLLPPPWPCTKCKSNMCLSNGFCWSVGESCTTERVQTHFNVDLDYGYCAPAASPTGVGKCTPCASPACLRCNSNKCLQCTNSSWCRSGHTCVQQNSLCKTADGANGYCADGGVCTVCFSPVAHCDTCNKTGCLTCAPQSNYRNLFNTKCVIKQCAGPAATGSPCEKCENGECTTCKSGFFLYNGRNISGALGSPSAFQRCVPCSQPQTNDGSSTALARPIVGGWPSPDRFSTHGEKMKIAYLCAGTNERQRYGGTVPAPALQSYNFLSACAGCRAADDEEIGKHQAISNICTKCGLPGQSPSNNNPFSDVGWAVKNPQPFTQNWWADSKEEALKKGYNNVPIDWKSPVRVLPPVNQWSSDCQGFLSHAWDSGGGNIDWGMPSPAAIWAQGDLDPRWTPCQEFDDRTPSSTWQKCTFRPMLGLCQNTTTPAWPSRQPPTQSDALCLIVSPMCNKAGNATAENCTTAVAPAYGDGDGSTARDKNKGAVVEPYWMGWDENDGDVDGPLCQKCNKSPAAAAVVCDWNKSLRALTLGSRGARPA